MSNNESPENFISKLPQTPLVAGPDIAAGVIPLPPTSLLSVSERLRLQELATAGVAPVEPAPPADDTVLTFEDGSFCKWLPRPGSTTQCILVDAAGKHLAIARDPDIADFLANACNLFLLAQLKHQMEGTQMQVVHKPIILPGV